MSPPIESPNKATDAYHATQPQSPPNGIVFAEMKVYFSFLRKVFAEIVTNNASHYCKKAEILMDIV